MQRFNNRSLCYYFFIEMFIYFLAVLFLSTVAGQTDSDDYVPYEGQRYDAFDWQLLKAFEASDLGNVIISPLSVKMVLAMLYEGATGSTEKELELVLQLPVSRQATRDRFQQIIHSLQSSSAEYALDMGSRVFMDLSVQPQQRFAAALKTFYDTDIKSINFNNTFQSVNEVNYWASNITHGRVNNLVSEGDLEDAVLILANALFYKGLWRTAFPRNRTTYGGFYLTPTKIVTVPYMFNYGRYYYTESSELDAKILRLPYKGSHISMFVILPNTKTGLRRLIKDVNPQVLKRHLWLMDIHYVHVSFPKFTFEFNAKLGRVLQKLGLQNIFQNTASLAGIARGTNTVKKLMVSNILQKAGIEVNEEGSTVWAATEVTLGNKFGSQDVVFNASNPFLFFIEDEFTGSVLFIGKVENPAQSDQLPFPEELNLPNRYAPTEFPVNSTIPSNNTNVSAPESQNPAVSLSESQSHLDPLDYNNNFGDLNSERFLFFDIELLKEIANNGPTGNFVVSPLSIKSTLAMILEGATRESAQELKSALRVGDDKRSIREQFRELLEKFKNSRNGVLLEIANRIFVSHNLTPLEDYRNVVNNYYNANVSLINFFSPADGAEAVNSWVNDHTHGLIPTILSPDNIDSRTQILLANAVYFKGIWKKEFDIRSTKPRCFYLPNGECYMTPMMDTIDTFKFAEVKNLDAKILELPYTGDKFSMIIVLPNKRNFDNQLIRDIGNSLNNIVENLKETDVLVALPRFKFEYTRDLVPALQQIGIKSIFTTNAALRYMVADVDAHVTNVIHKATIEVNEQGTEASAATAAAVIPLMGNIKPRFRADHTFFFFIRHNPTGTILFEGRVSQPEQAQQQFAGQQQQQQPQPQLQRQPQPQLQHQPQSQLLHQSQPQLLHQPQPQLLHQPQQSIPVRRTQPIEYRQSGTF